MFLLSTKIRAFCKGWEFFKLFRVKTGYLSKRKQKHLAYGKG